MELIGATALLLLACGVVILLSITQARKGKSKGRLPPGPTPLPILGNLLQLNGKEVFKSLKKLSEKYGPVYTIHMGMDPAVVLCSCDAVKEALIDNAEDFGARGHMPLLDVITSGGHGVVGSNGERWKQLRRFSLMTLRNFGMGKRSIEQRIQEEAQFLTEEFRKSNGQPLNPTLYFSKAVSNVICSVVFGNRFEYEDKEFLKLLGFLDEAFKLFSSVWGQIYNVYPKLMSKMPGPHQKMFNFIDGVREFVKKHVKAHKEILDPSDPRDFIDCFLIKMEQEKYIPETEFHMDAIVNTTFDMFTAGTLTVSTTLRYGLTILLKHPDIEERIHQEIDQVIGRNRAPSIEDRSRMPYTDAVIHEIQRFIDLIPLGLPHKVTRDLKFRDFFIPKGTTVFPMLSSVLQDPKQFKYPHQFYPGHFLDDKGKFCQNNGFMPFSSGKRICLGEGLAKMELFLFFTTILQNFSLRSPVNIKEIDLTPLTSGFGNFPRYYQLAFIPR
ncbi:LOW QUALITY PROTEIN: cytochrome P450 2A10-like [Bufo gargarizans]|uniref:LOW QUALITY PROTEIN: cytochrome P450 2A10-like n=1 Tax=Bufo gargarizans TaxID=30331 RepID=UPI001CF5FB10|nr:LOW QUALITY PROTEIN: cytochrome P450 2A10-like [Bufo gargarizans]